MDFLHFLRNVWAMLGKQLEKWHLNNHCFPETAQSVSSSCYFSTCFRTFRRKREIKMHLSICLLARQICLNQSRLDSHLYGSYASRSRLQITDNLHFTSYSGLKVSNSAFLCRKNHRCRRPPDACSLSSIPGTGWKLQPLSSASSPASYPAPFEPTG